MHLICNIIQGDAFFFFFLSKHFLIGYLYRLIFIGCSGKFKIDFFVSKKRCFFIKIPLKCQSLKMPPTSRPLQSQYSHLHGISGLPQIKKSPVTETRPGTKRLHLYKSLFQLRYRSLRVHRIRFSSRTVPYPPPRPTTGVLTQMHRKYTRRIPADARAEFSQTTKIRRRRRRRRRPLLVWPTGRHCSPDGIPETSVSHRYNGFLHFRQWYSQKISRH